jgi:small redox-active disulfide protein 2
MLLGGIDLVFGGDRNMEIKVLGPGCPKCKMTETIINEVISETGTDAKVEKVTDIGKINSHGVFMTPAVVVEGGVKCVGKVPSKEEVKKWLAG